MNKNLQTVFEYHETTKHSQQRYARSLGYMDWATQPNPFRSYEGTQTIILPLAFENTTPPYHLLDSKLPTAPLCRESIAQFLQFSMGIAAWKVSGDSSWAVRYNASSGNLHPTETYLILPPLLSEANSQSSVTHYKVEDHSLEVLALFDTEFWKTQTEGSFIVGLSSISWREVWKYGERAFRYVNLDAGHAFQALKISAKLLGWKITRLDSITNANLQSAMGLNQKSRFFEEEQADMLLLISPLQESLQTDIQTLLEDIPLFFKGIANELSPSMQEWDIIPAIEQATAVDELPQKSVMQNVHLPKASQESKDVLSKRRSIHVMDKETSTLTQEQFHTILASVSHSLDGRENSAHLVLFLQRVNQYEEGIYILIRNQRDLKELKSEISDDFEWSQTPYENLYLLDKRDTQFFAKSLSCGQDIAGDGAFSLSMLVNYTEQLTTHGAHRYKELYWECGAIGQQLYLEATSMGLSGTGIGCFLDDMLHNILELRSNRYQVLYNFTVGRGYVDSRIQTREAYKRG